VARASRSRPARGLIVDFGGVLTTSVGESLKAFCEREGIDHEALKGLVRSAYGVGTEPDAVVSMIETGRIDQREFERRMAALLSEGLDHPIEAEGLLSRMLADLHFDVPMVEAVRDIHRAGIPTALLSNSWGVEYYPRELLEDLFDQVVISGEVGVRKPDREVFLLAAERLRLAPQQCVFVDDTKGNVEAAQAVGMLGVVHERAEATIGELRRLLDVRIEARKTGSIATIVESP
jgi:epoxide hydrolase-like predicted phosphatase